MHTFYKYKFNKIDILNYLISLIPISLILGNLSTNINIALIVIIGFFIYGKQVFLIKNKTFQYLIYTFFIYIVLITFFNNLKYIHIETIYKDHIIKSFFYLRFLILFFVINKLIEDNNFSTKFFFTSCAFCSAIVAIDIVIQYIFGKNIIGYPLINNARASSFFGKELIAGGYLQKFSLFFIFYSIIKLKDKINNNLIIIILFIIFIIPMFFTLNKMPLIIFVMSFFLYLCLEKKFKEIFIVLLLCFVVGAVASHFSQNKRIKTDFKNFFNQTIEITSNATQLFLGNNKDTEIKSQYLLLFNSGIHVWNNNKIFGNGLKSYRLLCLNKKNQTCSNHPHNYFIEIMSEIGIFGLVVIYSIFILGTVNFFNFYYNQATSNARLTSVVFFLLIFFEFFPFRSSGSFFTTNNSAFIFLILPIFLNLKNLKKL